MMAKIEWYEEILTLEPGSKVFFPFAKRLAEDGLNEKALQVLRQGLLQHPEYLEARAFLAHLLYETGRTEEALTEAGQVYHRLALYPAFWESLSLARVSDAGDVDLALSFVAESLRTPGLDFADVMRKGLAKQTLAATLQSPVQPEQKPEIEGLPFAADDPLAPVLDEVVEREAESVPSDVVLPASFANEDTADQQGDTSSEFDEIPLLLSPWDVIPASAQSEEADDPVAEKLFAPLSDAVQALVDLADEEPEDAAEALLADASSLDEALSTMGGMPYAEESATFDDAPAPNEAAEESAEESAADSVDSLLSTDVSSADSVETASENQVPAEEIGDVGEIEERAKEQSDDEGVGEPLQGAEESDTIEEPADAVPMEEEEAAPAADTVTAEESSEPAELPVLSLEDLEDLDKALAGTTFPEDTALDTEPLLNIDELDEVLAEVDNLSEPGNLSDEEMTFPADNLEETEPRLSESPAASEEPEPLTSSETVEDAVADDVLIEDALTQKDDPSPVSDDADVFAADEAASVDDKAALEQEDAPAAADLSDTEPVSTAPDDTESESSGSEADFVDEDGPVRTRSMAEVLAEQGDLDGALAIYDELLEKASPDEGGSLKERMDALRGMKSAEKSVAAEPRPAARADKAGLRSMLENLAGRLEKRAKS